jgi:hypothetical protein
MGSDQYPIRNSASFDIYDGRRPGDRIGDLRQGEGPDLLSLFFYCTWGRGMSD